MQVAGFFIALTLLVACRMLQTMSDQLNQKELEKLHNYTKRVGVNEAAEKLGVHRQSLTAALARLPVRSGTIALIRQNLEAATGSTSTVTRGDATKPTTKREA